MRASVGGQLPGARAGDLCEAVGGRPAALPGRRPPPGPPPLPPPSHASAATQCPAAPRAHAPTHPRDHVTTRPTQSPGHPCPVPRAHPRAGGGLSHSEGGKGCSPIRKGVRGAAPRRAPRPHTTRRLHECARAHTPRRREVGGRDEGTVGSGLPLHPTASATGTLPSPFPISLHPHPSPPPTSYSFPLPQTEDQVHHFSDVPYWHQYFVKFPHGAVPEPAPRRAIST